MNKEKFKKSALHFAAAEKGLHFAAKKGHVDVAKVVLIQNGADVNAVDKYKSTALHCASQNGHVDVAKEVLI